MEGVASQKKNLLFYYKFNVFIMFLIEFKKKKIKF
jgi:hypothetical protein